MLRFWRNWVVIAASWLAAKIAQTMTSTLFVMNDIQIDVVCVGSCRQLVTGILWEIETAAFDAFSPKSAE